MRASALLALPAAVLLGLAGCATTPISNAVPSNAEPVAQGSGNVEYHTGQSGMLYIYDTTSQQVVYSGHVPADTLVKLDTDQNRIMIGDRDAGDRMLSAADNYQLYMEPRATAESSTTVEKKTTIRTSDNRE